MITDGGSCATSPDFPNDYPVNEGCIIYGLPPVGLDVIAFDVEGDPRPFLVDYDGDGDPTNDCPFDHLSVNGVKYCGTSGPAGRRLADAPLEAAEPGSRSGGGGRQIKEDLRGVEDGSGYQRDFRPVLARARALRPRE